VLKNTAVGSSARWPQVRDQPRRGHSLRQAARPLFANSDSCTAAKPPYSITSSARASSADGTFMPSALSVLRLTTSFVLGRRLHRQVGWLFALENAIHVSGRAPILLDCIRPISGEAALVGVIAIGIDRRQPKLRRKPDDHIAVKPGPSRGHAQAAVGAMRERRDATLHIVDIQRVDRTQLHSERRALVTCALTDSNNYYINNSYGSPA